MPHGGEEPLAAFPFGYAKENPNLDSEWPSVHLGEICFNQTPVLEGQPKGCCSEFGQFRERSIRSRRDDMEYTRQNISSWELLTKLQCHWGKQPTCKLGCGSHQIGPKRRLLPNIIIQPNVLQPSTKYKPGTTEQWTCAGLNRFVCRVKQLIGCLECSLA